MSRTLRTPRQQRLIDLLVERRKAAGLTQAALAARLDRFQSVIGSIESGSRRVDVVEFLDLADAIGFDPHEVLAALIDTPRQTR